MKDHESGSYGYMGMLGLAITAVGIMLIVNSCEPEQNNGMLTVGILLVVSVPLVWLLAQKAGGQTNPEEEDPHAGAVGAAVRYRQLVHEDELIRSFGFEVTVLGHLVRYPALMPMVKEKLQDHKWLPFPLNSTWVSTEKTLEIIERLGADADLAKVTKEIQNSRGIPAVNVSNGADWSALPDGSLEDAEVTLKAAIDALLELDRVRHQRACAVRLTPKQIEEAYDAMMAAYEKYKI